MKIPREQRPIDVTTLPPRQDNPPPQKKAPPAPPRRAAGTRPIATAFGSTWTWLSTPAALLTSVAWPAAANWLRLPRTRIVLLTLLSALAVGVVAARYRPPTVDGPALSTLGWHAVASGMGNAGRRSADPSAALDGNPETCWTTGRGQRNSDWFAVDMGKPQKFHQVILDTGKNVDEYPRAFAVYVSGDGVHWGVSVASGAGQGPMTVIDFAPQTARYIKVVQTGQDRHARWSLAEFSVH